MLRIREGFHPPSSSPCKDLPAFDPANIGASHHNLLYVANRVIRCIGWLVLSAGAQRLASGFLRVFARWAITFCLCGSTLSRVRVRASIIKTSGGRRASAGILKLSELSLKRFKKNHDFVTSEFFCEYPLLNDN